MLIDNITVRSPNVTYTDTHIESNYTYTSSDLECEDLGDGRSAWTISPVESDFQITTDRRVPRLGIMLVGLGGNNGSTLVGGVVANRE